MAVRAGDLGADVRADACFLGGHVEAGGGIDAIAIDQGHGGHAEIGAGRDQIFRQRSAFEETEGGAGVELDVSRHSPFVLLYSNYAAAPEGSQASVLCQKSCNVAKLSNRSKR